MALILDRPWRRQPKAPAKANTASDLGASLVKAISASTFNAQDWATTSRLQLDAGLAISSRSNGGGARVAASKLVAGLDYSTIVVVFSTKGYTAGTASLYCERSASTPILKLTVLSTSSVGFVFRNNSSQLINNATTASFTSRSSRPNVAALVTDGTASRTVFCNGAYSTNTSNYSNALDAFDARICGDAVDNAAIFTGGVYAVYLFSRALTLDELNYLDANPWALYEQRTNIPGAAAGGGGITGTLARTTADDTSAASGSTTIVGTLASTTAADTSVASGTVTIVGTLAVTTGADTSVASGTTTVIGTLARTTGADTSVASGNVGSGASGSLAVTTGADTSAASGTTTVVGTLARTTASDTVSASGVSGSVTGTLAVTSGSDTGYAYDVLPATVRKLENWYYRPALVPFSAEAWLVRELNTISRSTYGAAPFVQMVDVTVEPDKPNPGMVVFTTATAWDPGSGAGVYCYRSGAWHLLG